MAVAFPNQKFLHGGAIFLALIRIMTQSTEGFDPDRLVSALETKTVEEWGIHIGKLDGGDARANALHDAIMAVYNALPEINSTPGFELLPG